MKSSRNAKIIVSRDGSHTLEIEEMDETYHSRHGAITESEYVFIRQGLEQREEDQINLLEVGMGTGLNALLTALKAEDQKCNILYHTLEAFPIEAEVANQLNYPKDQAQQELFMKLHTSTWDEEVSVSPFFTLCKYHAKMENIKLRSEFYHLVYYDAFAPSRQSEMWKPDRLEQVYNAMKPGGTFVTYCAQGQFKRDMKALGFEVESLPGPPGKAEMVRAQKPGII